MKHKLKLKQFINFLKVNNIYDEYLICLTNKWGENGSTKFIIDKIKNCPTYMINAAFAWSDSKNIDILTWARLNNEWVVLCQILTDKARGLPCNGFRENKIKP